MTRGGGGGCKGSLKQGNDCETEAERGQGQEMGRTQWRIARGPWECFVNIVDFMNEL